MGKAEKNTIFLILLVASAISLPIFSNRLSSTRDSAALSLTPQEFDSLIIRTDRVAVFFSATGCLDCNRMRSLWLALSVKYSDSISFVEVEYSLMTSRVFDRYDVLETPTFILFVGGANVSRYDGSFASPDKLDQFLQTAYGTDHAIKSSALGNQSTFFPGSESPSLLISIILGISVFASPCVLPFVPGYLAFLFAGGKKSKSRIGVASASSLVFGAASILLVGFIFVILGDVFWSLLLMGKLLISFVLLALGLAMLFDVGALTMAPKILNVSSGEGAEFARSVSTYSLLFGFLSLSCSLPFLVGALLNIVAGVDVYSMALRLLAFAVGFASPLAALTFATGVGVSISASRLRKVSSIMSKIGGASMIAASLLLLVTL
jgi:cytochrome c biogenesis protein CcdA